MCWEATSTVAVHMMKLLLVVSVRLYNVLSRYFISFKALIRSTVV